MDIFKILGIGLIFLIIIAIIVAIFGEKTLIIFIGYLIILGILHINKKILLFSNGGLVQIWGLEDFFNSIYKIFCNYTSIFIAFIISVILGILAKK